jgi:seryl-tRNA synthetase
MYRYYKGGDGFAPGLYRTPEQIKRDMREIGEKLSETVYMLNVRNVLSEIISESCGDDLARRAVAVRELVDEAAEARAKLAELEAALDELRAELEESILVIGAV